MLEGPGATIPTLVPPATSHLCCIRIPSNRMRIGRARTRAAARYSATSRAQPRSTRCRGSSGSGSMSPALTSTKKQGPGSHQTNPRPAPRSLVPHCKPTCSPPSNAAPAWPHAPNNSRTACPRSSPNKPGAHADSAHPPTSTRELRKPNGLTHENCPHTVPLEGNDDQC